MIHSRIGLAALLIAARLVTPCAAQPKAPAAVTLRQQDGGVVFIAYTPDGKSLITTTYEGAIRKWDSATGKELLQIEKPIKLDGSTADVRCRSAALSPDGKYIGVLTYASTLNLYTVADGKPYGQIVTGEDQLTGAFALAFAPDSKSVATSKYQGRAISLWDLATGKESRQFGDHLKPKGIAAGHHSLGTDGKQLFTHNAGNSLKRWDLDGKELSPLSGPAGASSVVFARDGKLAAWVVGGAIRIWDMATNKELRALEGSGTARTFSADNKRLAGRDSDRILCVWDTASGKLLHKYGEKPTSLILSARADFAAFSTDNTRLAAALGNEVRVWEVATGKEITFSK